MKKLTLLLLVLVGCAEKQSGDEIYLVAREASDQENFALAISAGKKALELFTDAQDSAGQIRSSYLISRAYANTERFDSALRFAKVGSEISRAVGDFESEYKLNNTMSWAYFMLGKSFEETLEHNQRQLEVVEKLDDDDARASVYNNYGYDGTVSGIVPIADLIPYSKFANDHYAKQETNSGRWYTLMNLSWQYRLLDDIPKAIGYGVLSLDQAMKDDDRHAIVEAAAAVGEAMLEANMLADARTYYDKGQQYGDLKVDRDKYVYDVYYSRFLWRSGKKKEALSRLESAIEFLQNSEIFYEMLGRAYLAELLYESGDYDGVMEQLVVFDNPRARYFSQEAIILARITEIRMLSKTDTDRANLKLGESLDLIIKSGAELLLRKLEEVQKEISESTPS